MAGVALGMALARGTELFNRERQREQEIAATDIRNRLLQEQLNEFEAGSELRNLNRELQTKEAREKVSSFASEAGLRALDRAYRIKQAREAANDYDLTIAAKRAIAPELNAIDAGDTQAFARALNKLNSASGVTYQVADDPDGFKNGLKMIRTYPDGRSEEYTAPVTSGNEAVAILGQYVQTPQARMATAEAMRSGRIQSERDYALELNKHRMKMEQIIAEKSPSDKDVFETALNLALMKNSLADIEDLRVAPPEIKANVFTDLEVNIARVANARKDKTGFRPVEAMVRNLAQQVAEAPAVAVANDAKKTSQAKGISEVVFGHVPSAGGLSNLKPSLPQDYYLDPYGAGAPAGADTGERKSSLGLTLPAGAGLEQVSPWSIRVPAGADTPAAPAQLPPMGTSVGAGLKSIVPRKAQASTGTSSSYKYDMPEMEVQMLYDEARRRNPQRMQGVSMDEFASEVSTYSPVVRRRVIEEIVSRSRSAAGLPSAQ